MSKFWTIKAKKMYCLVTGKHKTRKVHYAFYSRKVAKESYYQDFLPNHSDARIVTLPEEIALRLETN
ncbi:MAG TPA: hypothetical protein VE971_00475 [Candidatus Eisenbacteria bacterium]|nr:hypothetical protein [Candidatus Eisenbacteria bacterium]